MDQHSSCPGDGVDTAEGSSSNSPSIPRPGFAWRWTLSTILICLLGLFPAYMGAAQAPPSNACYRTSLPSDPLWIYSQTWTRDAAAPEILLADNGRLSVERVTPNRMRPVEFGEIKATLRVPESRIQGPSGIWPYRSQGYLIEFKVPWKLLHIDENFRVLEEHSPNPETALGEYGSYPPFLMAPVGDSGFLAFGDVTEEANREGAYHSALTFFDLDNRLQVFEETKVRVGTEVRDRYSLNFMPYLAGNSEAGFILFLDDEAAIGRFEPGQSKVTRLPDIPKGLRSRPNLKRVRGVPGTRQAFLFYQQLEKEDFAAAIYTLGPDNLYLLARKALHDREKAAWSLIRLDPITGAEQYRKRLPTEAANLSLVPGETFWALIEKAPVRPLPIESAPYMRVTSMVVLPASWLEAENEGRLHPHLPVVCDTFDGESF